MPIPAAPAGGTVAEAITALFQQLHDQIRAEVCGLTDEDLNWAPFAGANSIAVTIRHLLGSEAESLQAAAGMECRRDRDAEFRADRASVTDIEALLDAADSLLIAASPKLDERLWIPMPLPTLPHDELRPSITWAIGNYGHAREHIGHIQLTRDLRRRAVS